VENWGGFQSHHGKVLKLGLNAPARRIVVVRIFLAYA
jgi:hypothetical protein